MKGRYRKKKHPSCLSPIVINTPVHYSQYEPWSKSRIQKLLVVMKSDCEPYMGYDDLVEEVLSEADRVINTCPSLIPAENRADACALVIPSTYIRTKDTEKCSSPHSVLEGKPPSEPPTSINSTLETTGNIDTLPDITGKTPFEILADFNRKGPTNQVVFSHKGSKSTYKSPSDLNLSLPSGESILKSLSELRTQRIAAQERIARFEEVVGSQVSSQQ